MQVCPFCSQFRAAPVEPPKEPEQREGRKVWGNAGKWQKPKLELAKNYKPLDRDEVVRLHGWDEAQRLFPDP